MKHSGRLARPVRLLTCLLKHPATYSLPHPFSTITPFRRSLLLRAMLLARSGPAGLGNRPEAESLALV